MLRLQMGYFSSCLLNVHVSIQFEEGRALEPQLMVAAVAQCKQLWLNEQHQGVSDSTLDI